MAGPSGPFDVTYCQPKTPTPPKGRPCILYLHGGGWQYGSRKVVLPFCRYLAEQANAVVAVPEYHLAPEHRWPAALEDCWQLLCRLHRCTGDGTLEIAAKESGASALVFPVTASNTWQTAMGTLQLDGEQELWFTYRGTGALDLRGFKL